MKIKLNKKIIMTKLMTHLTTKKQRKWFQMTSTPDCTTNSKMHNYPHNKDKKRKELLFIRPWHKGSLSTKLFQKSDCNSPAEKLHTQAVDWFGNWREKKVIEEMSGGSSKSAASQSASSGTVKGTSGNPEAHRLQREGVGGTRCQQINDNKLHNSVISQTVI